MNSNKDEAATYLRLSKEEFSNEEFVGKHLSSITLRTFIEQYSDEEADRFIIDSEFDNDIAFKCYKGAGFVDVDKYVVKDGFFKGKKLHLMIRGS